VLVKKAIDEFLDYPVVELNRSQATQDGYRKDLNVFSRFLKSNDRESISLEGLTSELLSEYVRYLTKDRDSKPNTVRRHVTAIKSFCGFLADSEYLENNPAANLPRPRMPQKHPRHLQKKEVVGLFAAVPENGSPSMLRNKTALKCLYYTGIRVSELVNIRREDIDFENGFIKIIKGKGSKYRKVPLYRELKSQLQKYFSEAPGLVNGYLFCNKQGQHITTDYVYYIISEYAIKAGLRKKVTPHTLRHSFATHLYREGVDINTLGKLLGHAGIRSTAVYTHSDLKHLRQHNAEDKKAKGRAKGGGALHLGGGGQNRIPE